MSIRVNRPSTVYRRSRSDRGETVHSPPREKRGEPLEFQRLPWIGAIEFSGLLFAVAFGVVFGGFVPALACPSLLALALASLGRTFVLVALLVLNLLGPSRAARFGGAVVIVRALLPVACRRRDRQQRNSNHR